MLLGAAFGLVFWVLIGKFFNYLSIEIFSGISLGMVIDSKINRNYLFNKKNKISGNTAEAGPVKLYLKQSNIERIELDIILYKK